MQQIGKYISSLKEQVQITAEVTSFFLFFFPPEIFVEKVHSIYLTYL